LCIEDLEDSALIVCDKETVELGGISNALRCTEASNGMDSLALAQIEHFNGVITERAHEQSFALCVEIEVINSSFDSGQRDRLLQLDPRVTRFSDCSTNSGDCDS
jgi:hypothetical protein